jgi:hypothetical protein
MQSLQLPETCFETDSYTALRGSFVAAVSGTHQLRIAGASWFQVWMDGEWLTEGPARFVQGMPEYETIEVPLPAGPHVLAITLNHHGVETRLLKKMDPFLLVGLAVPGGVEELLTWKSAPLPSYHPALRRINPQLGWCEWCDTRQHPLDWQGVGFDDSSWQPLTSTAADLLTGPLQIGRVQQFPFNLEPTAEGHLVERFGYEPDDPPARFLMRNLFPADIPPQGVWRRFDLGRVRLGRAEITLDVPEGTVVEMAYAETLLDGRVAPFITLSCGTSCNLDHYVARGGRQTFGPMAPRGGRYLEVHILACPERARWEKVQFLERCYHGKPEGAFACEDPLLNRIWSTGVETLRACTEDALADNPTRERGQWTGDVVSVGLHLTSVAYGDLRILRRGLVQAALSANANGLVAGLCPGGEVYLGSYAAQWVSACLHYAQLTGDVALLHEMLPHAVRNLEAFDPFLSDEGLQNGIEWPFIDWGFIAEEGAINLPMNLHLLQAYRAFLEWCELLGQSAPANDFRTKEETLGRALSKHVAAGMQPGHSGLGYHSAVLALASDVVPVTRRHECVDFIKAHILGCFPNNPEAPRLSDPSANHEQLITPYFAHYAFDVLIHEGEMSFVLDQYRKSWGWMLEKESGTWLEVFDERWSHSHQWSGCPTWQLSRYSLGLTPNALHAPHHYEFSLFPGDLQKVEGRLPIPGTGEVLTIQWERLEGEIHYQLSTPLPITIAGIPGHEGTLQVSSSWKGMIPHA